VLPSVKDTGGGARLAARTLAIHHQSQVVDGAEQKQAHEATEPPMDRLPGWKVAGQHLPAAARANQVTDRIHPLSQIRLARPAFLYGLRKQRRDHQSVLVGQVRRVSPELASRKATRLGIPHTKLESRHLIAGNHFSKTL
jgi:hypothetical protein